VTPLALGVAAAPWLGGPFEPEGIYAGTGTDCPGDTGSTIVVINPVSTS
jgi:hypothetical protein